MWVKIRINEALCPGEDNQRQKLAGKVLHPTHRDETAMNGAPDFYGGSFEENKQKQMQMRGFFAFGSE
jgi:hypothetical protein